MAKKTKKGGEISLKPPRWREFRLEDLQAADYNPRVISDEALAGLQRSIERFGYVEPIVVNVRGGGRRIVGGHQRFKALAALGVAKAVCVTVNCTETEERLLNLTLNNPEIQGRFVADLADHIAKLRADLDDDTTLLDLRIAELAGGLAAASNEGRIPDDQIPEPPKKAITRAGDLWILGEHRLLCGDATKAEDMEMAAAGRVDLTISSPPYNVGVDYSSYRDRAARAEYLAFIEKVAAHIFTATKPGRFVAWNVGVSPKTYHAWQTITFENAGFSFYRQIVWEKAGIHYPIFPSSMRAKQARHYKPNYKHEVVVVMQKGRSRTVNIVCPTCEGHGEVEPEPLPIEESHEIVTLMVKGDTPDIGGPIAFDKTYQNDVWKIPQFEATADLKTVGNTSGTLRRGGKPTHRLKEHPAPYPVKLPSALMTFLSAPGERIFDPFLGAGSTMIAATKLDRSCCGLEIDPKYCDVIVERWQQFTGGKAKRQRRGKR